MLDLLQLVEQDATLQEELVELAPQELGDAELDTVAGGRDLQQALKTLGDDAQLAQMDLQNWAQKTTQTLTMMSTISNTMHHVSSSIIRNMR